MESLTRGEEDRPKPQRGEVLVRVRAVALNFRDLAIATNRYVWPAKAGLIPCSDAAGEIIEVGEGVTEFKLGDRVISTFHPRWFAGRPPVNIMAESYGSGQDGWLVQYKACSQDAVVRAPNGLSFAEAATLPCAGVTAWNALQGPNPIGPGDIVLTQGTGGVSVFAVQLAKALGAKVIALTSSGAKEQFLKTLGADETVNYTIVPEWGPAVRKLSRGGVDRVLEVVGPATVLESLKAVRWNAEVVLIGFLSKVGPPIDYFQLKGSGASVRSIGVGDRVMLSTLVRVVESSGLRPVVDKEFPFDESLQAFQHLAEAKHVGKVVIRVD